MLLTDRGRILLLHEQARSLANTYEEVSPVAIIRHIFVPELECVNKFGFKVDTVDLLSDIKVLLKEYYLATFAEDGNALDIKFNNGQKFRLKITEM